MITRGWHSVQLSLLLLALAVLWALCGAPLTGEEFAALPGDCLRMLRQLPRRMAGVLALWLA